MDFAFNAEQEELRATARDFLLERAGPEQVRRAMESELGYDPELWKSAAELGWLGAAIPEQYGGAGFGHRGLWTVPDCATSAPGGPPLDERTGARSQAAPP